jgi:hypothetical protein
VNAERGVKVLEDWVDAVDIVVGVLEEEDRDILAYLERTLPTLEGRETRKGDEMSGERMLLATTTAALWSLCVVYELSEEIDRDMTLGAVRHLLLRWVSEMDPL